MPTAHCQPNVETPLGRTSMANEHAVQFILESSMKIPLSNLACTLSPRETLAAQFRSASAAARTLHCGDWQLRSCCSPPAWLLRTRPGTLQRLGRRSAGAPVICSPSAYHASDVRASCNKRAQAQRSPNRPACKVPVSERKACRVLPPGHAQGSLGETLSVRFQQPHCLHGLMAEDTCTCKQTPYAPSL